MASDSESDYELELSEETRKILQQVMAEKEAETERFEALKRQAENEFDQVKQADMSLFTENWQLSQFWYDDETSRELGQEALDNTDETSTIVCISSPSAFVKLLTSQWLLLEHDDDCFSQKIQCLQKLRVQGFDYDYDYGDYGDYDYDYCL
ncbi:hypothetical protein BG004_005764 [Podila humilis]|nr:hypothetical protein BG004_005764 [Podila humilis]